MDTESRQFAKELLKPIDKKYPTRKVITSDNDITWGADLLDLSNLSKYNKGIHFLLVIVDLYSRFAYVIPLKNKNSSSILNAFQSLKRLPKKLWVDQGKEFLNKSFKEFLKEKDIIIYHTYSTQKSVFAETFNRTLRSLLNEYMLIHNTQKYIDVLPKIVNDYNNRTHSSTNLIPAAVYNSDDIKYNPGELERADKLKFDVGDLVRISRLKGTFEKGTTERWSREVFKIALINDYEPPLYQLEDLQSEDIKGSFYEEELQLTKVPFYRVINKILKRKTNKGKKLIYVSYKGWPSKFNEWIPASKK